MHALDPEKKGFTKVSDPEKLRRILLELCKDKLRHAIGRRYAKAAEICLTPDLGDGLDSWQFQRFVREQVVGRLK